MSALRRAGDRDFPHAFLPQSTGAFAALLALCIGALAAPPGTYTKRIAVDQFGYAPDMIKVAVISDPQTGFNAAEGYTPGANLEVRSWPDHTAVF